MRFLRVYLFPIAELIFAFPHFSFSQQVFQPAKSDSALLILNKEKATLVIIDGETLEIIAKIPTGDFPHEVNTSPNGKTT